MRHVLLLASWRILSRLDGHWDVDSLSGTIWVGHLNREGVVARIHVIAWRCSTGTIFIDGHPLWGIGTLSKLRTLRQTITTSVGRNLNWGFLTLSCINRSIRRLVRHVLHLASWGLLGHGHWNVNRVLRVVWVDDVDWHVVGTGLQVSSWVQSDGAVWVDGRPILDART